MFDFKTPSSFLQNQAGFFIQQCPALLKSVLWSYIRVEAGRQPFQESIPKERDKKFICKVTPNLLSSSLLCWRLLCRPCLLITQHDFLQGCPWRNMPGLWWEWDISPASKLLWYRGLCKWRDSCGLGLQMLCVTPAVLPLPFLPACQSSTPSSRFGGEGAPGVGIDFPATSSFCKGHCLAFMLFGTWPLA